MFVCTFYIFFIYSILFIYCQHNKLYGPMCVSLFRMLIYRHFYYNASKCFGRRRDISYQYIQLEGSSTHFIVEYSCAQMYCRMSLNIIFKICKHVPPVCSIY